MSKELAVMLLGFWIIVVTQLGIPGGWRTSILVLTGAIVAALGFFLRAESLGRSKRPTNHHFVENGAPAHTPEHDRTETERLN